MTSYVYALIYTGPDVNGVIYMNFKETIDALCETMDHRAVAEALGVSVQTIRQARMQPGSKAFRAPPRDWKDIAIRLAEERVWHYRKLIEDIRSDRHGEK